MNVLMVGKSGGSWVMRGQQIGAVLGARVTSSPTDADWRWADVAVLVKHAGIGFAKQAHAFDVPIVWDVLDCWQQPEENTLTVEQGQALIAGLQARIKPAAMIAATQRMAEDICGIYIPHHCRIGLKPQPVRERVWTVAYDGQVKYLGRWYRAIEDECRNRGWRFVVNPFDLAQADILVAFRDGRWDGPLCRAWKSGVKYVNALCAGRPVLTQRSSAVSEILDLVSVEIENEQDMTDGFDRCDQSRERAGRAHYSSVIYSAAALAESYYRPLLERVTARVAA